MKKDCIFVSIASYRDDVCHDTLISLYKMANNPQNVYVGICQQNKKKNEDVDCVGNYYNQNVRIIRISHEEAKGPVYARYLCSTLWNEEEYYMQIDSHSKFVKDWDVKCINMINEIKVNGLSKKPVLSHYPKEINEYKNHKDYDLTLPRICKPFFNSRDMISFMGSEILNTEGKYYLTPFVAGGMIFCESYFIHELPYDNNLDYIFVGEEILHSIRFYTNGWDIFTPKENIVFHEYTRSDKPKIWTDNPYYSDMNAFNKIRYLLKLDESDEKVTVEMKHNLERYGLGKSRTIEQYYELTGINLKERKVYKNFCKKNNIASEEDILKSNELNWSKEEYKSYDYGKKKYSHCIYFLLIIILIFCLWNIF